MKTLALFFLATFAGLSQSVDAAETQNLVFFNQSGKRALVCIESLGSGVKNKIWEHMFSGYDLDATAILPVGHIYPITVIVWRSGNKAEIERSYETLQGVVSDTLVITKEANLVRLRDNPSLYLHEPAQKDTAVSFTDTLLYAETSRPKDFPVTLDKKTSLVIRNFLPGTMEVHVGHGGIFSDRSDRKESKIPSHRQSVLVLEQGHDHDLRIKYTVGGRQEEVRWAYRALRNVWADTLNFGGPHKGFIHNITSQLVLVMPAENSIGIKNQVRRVFTEQDNEWVRTNYPQQDWDRIVSLYERSLKSGAILLYPGEHADVYRAAPQVDSLATYFGLRACMVRVDINVIPRDTPFNGVYYDWGAEIRPSAEVKAERVRNNFR